ncbi:DNA alkylation repair protein [Nocardioides sp. InS609-2]|uniref:DNA alkylation repair protein n=1 Tax=Nocardioides sp. InS609-2 TaxID=2760705 RepID=UPI00185E316C|nr:DNA alkylation repair protein [Nocardioides sp. InS609-2]MBA3780887.1 DNA alkylation repair protein [Nocardioides sp.]
MDAPLTADAVVTALEAHRDENELATVRRRLAADEPAIGMRMADLFATAKSFTSLPLDEVEALLEHPAYEPRMAAFCILDFQVRGRLDDEARTERYDLYLRRHDRITTWDMVDRSAPRVVGGHLVGSSLAPLHKLADSAVPLERRTAITAPLYFVKSGSFADLAGGFDLAARLATDAEPVVQNAVGIFLKHAGTADEAGLRSFLDQHAASMPRPGLRLAIEKLPPGVRAAYLL